MKNVINAGIVMSAIALAVPSLLQAAAPQMLLLSCSASDSTADFKAIDVFGTISDDGASISSVAAVVSVSFDAGPTKILYQGGIASVAPNSNVVYADIIEPGDSLSVKDGVAILTRKGKKISFSDCR